MSGKTFTAATALFLAGTAWAQAPLKFEVATVKLGDSGKLPNGMVRPQSITGGIGSSNPEQISYRGEWLANLIATAYGVRPDYVTGPDWLGEQRYDIVAKIPPGTAREQFQVMLQNLLRERFQLSFHRETKKKDVYVLVVGKKGSKLTPYIEPSVDNSNPPRASAVDPNGFPAFPPAYVGIALIPSATQSRMAGQGVDVKAIASSLETATGRPLVDATGLTGKYNFRLSYERSAQRGATGQAEPGADIFGAVAEQLGLEMESRSMPVEILVIDTLNRQPTEN